MPLERILVLCHRPPPSLPTQGTCGGRLVNATDPLAPLQLREAGGGITMTGRLATQVARDPRVHLVGYGPSASTIGANRAGAAAARELIDHLGLAPATPNPEGDH